MMMTLQVVVVEQYQGWIGGFVVWLREREKGRVDLVFDPSQIFDSDVITLGWCRLDSALGPKFRIGKVGLWEWT